MDEKSKKKKKLKQKQNQRQKQKQSVIVNVNLAKSRKKSSGQSKPQNQRVQLPPPVHKVYASPIHDLVPQMFNKEGKQASQPTLAEQIGQVLEKVNKYEKYLQGQEQAKQSNILGEKPNDISALKASSSLLSNPTKTKTTIKTKKKGRPPGSLNKGLTKAEILRKKEEAIERVEDLERETKSQSAVLSMLGKEGLSEIKAKQNPPEQFIRESTSLSKEESSEKEPQIESFYSATRTPEFLRELLSNQPSQQSQSLEEPQTEEEEEEEIKTIIPKKKSNKKQK